MQTEEQKNIPKNEQEKIKSVYSIITDSFIYRYLFFYSRLHVFMRNTFLLLCPLYIQDVSVLICHSLFLSVCGYVYCISSQQNEWSMKPSVSWLDENYTGFIRCLKPCRWLSLSWGVRHMHTQRCLSECYEVKRTHIQLHKNALACMNTDSEFLKIL